MGLLQCIGVDEAAGLRQGHATACWGLGAGGWARRRAVPFGSAYPAACVWVGLWPGGEVALGLEGFPTALTYALSLWQPLALR